MCSHGGNIYRLRDRKRPWASPIGYQCVYESYFWKDMRLWFPIPRLITSFCFRRDAPISQFVNGSFWIAVALMVMAAEIVVSMSVRIFEEMTQTQTLPNSLILVRMRSNLHIMTGNPWKTKYGSVTTSTSSLTRQPLKNHLTIATKCCGVMTLTRQLIFGQENFTRPVWSWSDQN